MSFFTVKATLGAALSQPLIDAGVQLTRVIHAIRLGVKNRGPGETDTDSFIDSLSR